MTTKKLSIARALRLLRAADAEGRAAEAAAIRREHPELLPNPLHVPTQYLCIEHAALAAGTGGLNIIVVEDTHDCDACD